MATMPAHPIAGRLAAALIAAVAWTGLLVQFFELLPQNGPVTALSTMLSFFTITTNLLVAFVFSALALGRPVSPRLVAFTMLSIVLVGTVNAALLWGLLELSGGSALVDRLLHVTTPIATLIFWIVFTPKGHLTRRDPLLWAIYPLLYLAYALTRGFSSGRFAYPFLNLSTLGWPRVILNAAVIAAAFLAASFATVWVDGRLAVRTSTAPARI